MLLPISAAAKGVLWTILFGLAKTCQYGGLTILGVEGYNRLKNWIKRRKDDGEDKVYHRAYYIPEPREPNFDRLCHYCATKNGFFCTKNEVCKKIIICAPR